MGPGTGPESLRGERQAGKQRGAAFAACSPRLCGGQARLRAPLDQGEREPPQGRLRPCPRGPPGGLKGLQQEEAGGSRGFLG